LQVPNVPRDGTPSPRFGLSLLGGFELTGPTGVVDLPSKKLAGLLTYLACTAPRPQSREKLSTLLWGSHFDARANQNLRQALFRLRKVLGQDALQTDGDVVSLNTAAVLCDVGRFEALVRDGSRDALGAAGDLYRGRLIDDNTIDEEGWNEWLASERERLLELALGAMMGLGEQELAAGRAERALKAGQRAIALNNMREDAHRLVVLALTATGRKAEALRHYDDLVALLKRELDAEPDAATRSLVAQLRVVELPGRSFPIKAAEPALPRPDGRPIAVPPVGDVNRGSERDDADNPPAQSDELSSAVAIRTGVSERRQLTILACNMVGPMPPSALLDPEDMRDLIASFHKAITDVVSHFDGFVAQYLDDGALVYFGYPVTHEHDTEQAVRAGLAILDAVSMKTTSDVPLQASVGIATGLVVVGERAGTGDTRRVAIGEAPGMAAQLRAAASVGEIVISASTHRLVGRMFDCRAFNLKGTPQPVEAWQVRGETAGVSRFEARRPAGELTLLVGRQEEIELLLRRWHQAKLCEGAVVLLSGEPGIGKSRIAESLLSRLDGEPHARLRYFCSPHRTYSPLYPFIGQLEQAAGFEPGSDTTAKFDKLEALLKPSAKNPARDVALFAELLGLPADKRYPALAVSPAQKREMILTSILDQLDSVAAQSPVLIVIEDVHWIDPTSLDLLDRLVARVASMPVLLVVTSRPEFQPTSIGQPHVTMLPLSRLGRRDSVSIIRGIAGGKALPGAIVEQIVSRTDGVPLFIEELTRVLLESGLLRETTDGYMLDGRLPTLAIPTSLQASLVARLDRLASVKDVAQIGAAIGREFSHELISAVAALTPEDLDAALERLTASGLISRRGTPPEATYSFKHALVQDAAYATMLRSRRRQLHADIAQVLVERFVALAESLPEVVARHCAKADLAPEAIGYWAKAGRLAQARWANREAVEFFEQALHLLETLPKTRERMEQAIDLRFDLRNALFPLGEFERISGYLREAEGLAKTIDDRQRLGQLYIYLCHNLVMTGHPTEARAFGQAAQSIAESLGHGPLQVTGNLYLGAACLYTGDYGQAEDLFRKALHFLEGDRSRERFGLAGYPAVMARAYLILGFADRGMFKEGIAQGQEGIRLAEAFDHPYSLVYACWVLANLHIIRGELGHAVPLLERGLALAREWNLTYFSVDHTRSLGYAYALAGRIAEGIPLLEQALSSIETMGYGVVQPLYLAYLGEAYVLDNRLDDAGECARRALSLARAGGQRTYEAGALWLLGEVTARRDSLEHADGYYGQALVLAEALGMRPLVAHCHLGLGKSYLRTGKRKQAHDRLTVATTMYRDMDMTYWLDRAEAEIAAI